MQWFKDLGTTSEQKKRFNSGIARISQKSPPHPPIRATLPTLSAVATIDETFSLSKKRAQKNSGKGKPPPQFGQCPNWNVFFVLPSSLSPPLLLTLKLAKNKIYCFSRVKYLVSQDGRILWGGTVTGFTSGAPQAVKFSLGLMETS